MSVDMDNLRFVPSDKVPYKKTTKWDDIFNKIPKGQALVLTEGEAKPDNVRAALLRRQKEGRFKNLEMISRGRRGQRVSYVINAGKSQADIKKT